MAQTQLPGTQVKDSSLKDVDIASDAGIAVSKLASTTSTLVGTKSTGGTVALTPAEARVILNIADGSQANASGGILTSELDLGENAGLILDATLSADGKYSGISEAGTCGEALAFGDCCYFKAADSKWYLAKADAVSTSGDVKIGMCVLAGSTNAATKMLLFGKIRADAKFPTMTISAPVHISAATAGAIVVAAPTGPDSVTRRLGHGNTADELYFNPSPDYYTHT